MNKIALVFPGQGAQHLGMGKSLYEEFDVAKQVFEEAQETLGINFSNLCFNGRVTELNKLENLLPAILTVSVAAFRVYMKEIGIKPQVVAGHSLGEYSALVCSGAMEFKDALKIVRKRGELANIIVDQYSAGMTIVNNIDNSIVEKECQKLIANKKKVFISCYNSDRQVSLCGHNEALMEIEKVLINLGAEVTPLLSSAPFHSILMEPIFLEFKEYLKIFNYKNFNWPVISNANPNKCHKRVDIIDNLSLQLIKPIKWNDTMNCLENMGVDTIIEIGPQNILKNLINDNYSNLDVLTLNKSKDISTIKKLLSQHQNCVANNELKKNKVFKHNVVSYCLMNSITTQNWNHNQNDYENVVIKSCNVLKELYQKLNNNNMEPSVDEMKISMDMLFQIFKTKKIPVEEQISRFQQIVQETSTDEVFGDFIERRYGKDVK